MVQYEPDDIPSVAEKTSIELLPGMSLLNLFAPVPDPEPLRVVGHPDLADDSFHRAGETLYISVGAAIRRQRRGEIAEVRLASTPEDDEALAGYREAIIKSRESDPASVLDGWNR